MPAHVLEIQVTRYWFDSDPISKACIFRRWVLRQFRWLLDNPWGRVSRSIQHDHSGMRRGQVRAVHEPLRLHGLDEENCKRKLTLD